eukprot:TRINITY_DN20324_c0_g1_i1.p1 TRINITY_DN20324_c0_g1~~TRINITY_DN20324_c0_g1_i1.p1  ORF type:complete len:164 (-),score=73.07 TRINITY_DN20324_c0_g1_i1:429-920(-)
MEDFKDSPTSLVADVDCTTEGKELCEKHGVQGYPSIKWGSPDAMEDYQGGRSYDDLKAFADENLGPSCGPGSLDLCSDEKKAVIEKFMKMSEGKRDAKIRKWEKELAKIEEDFEGFTKGLQEEYESENKKKEDTVSEIKNSGLGMMKSVLAHRKSADGSKAEL